MDPAWLFGAGGQAFALSISRETLCPSGPTAWWTEGLHGLLANLGLARECIFSHRGSDDFATASAQVWEAAQSALEQDFPCYAWELKLPEYSVLTGVTEEGYLFSGPLAEPGEVKPWEELGQSEIGVVEFCSVWRGVQRPGLGRVPGIRPALSADGRKRPARVAGWVGTRRRLLRRRSR
jgi:hypothetical protein